MMAAFWITNNCNLDCKYCYEGSNKPPNNMSIETARKAMEYTLGHFEKREDDKLMVVFHGGEPLLEFELLKQIVKDFKNYFLSKNKLLMFSITTNGILINDEIEDFLCENFTSLSVSIDGAKESHDANRVFADGSGTYEIVFNKFLKILSRRPDVRARMTFNSTTVSRLYTDIKYLVDSGFKNIIPIPDFFDKKFSGEHLQILNNELKKSVILFKTRKMKNKDLFIGLINDKAIKKRNSECLGGSNSIHINTDGNLYPCIYTVGNTNYVIGNIFDGIKQSKIEEISNCSKNNNLECVGCNNYDYCAATRCKLINKVMTGDYHTPSVLFCSIENVKHKVTKFYQQV
jgi:uncharacterized protein